MKTECGKLKYPILKQIIIKTMIIEIKFGKKVCKNLRKEMIKSPKL